MTFIKPTVGRVVQFFHRTGDIEVPAIITKVWSDSVVNLAIFNEDGSPMQNPPTSINLVQDGGEVPAGRYCRWMPFQLGQAQKTAEAEAVAKKVRQGFENG